MNRIFEGQVAWVSNKQCWDLNKMKVLESRLLQP